MKRTATVVNLPHTYSFLQPAPAADVAEVCRRQEAAHKPDTTLHIRMLGPLLQERGSLEYRIADRRHFISMVEPNIPIIRERLEQLKADLKELQDLAATGVSLKNQIENKRKKLEHAEWDLRSEQERLDVAKTILKGTTKILKEFDAANGETIKKLRALDKAIDGERKQPFRR